MSLLTIVQAAAQRIGVAMPSAVIGAIDPAIIEMGRLVNVGGRSLAERVEWQALMREHVFATVAAAEQPSSVPNGFGRMVNESVFDRTQRRRVWGPVSATEWQAIQASAQTSIDKRYRIRGDTMLITPTPEAGTTLAYEYITKNWVAHAATDPAGVTYGPAMTVDTDTSLLDETLHEDDLVWRWKQVKGLDYEFDRSVAERRILDAELRTGTRATISGNMVTTDRVPYPPWTPDTLVFT